MVIGHRSLRLGLAVYHPGRQLVLSAGVLGKVLPDSLLKIGRLRIVDGENRGEAKLADDLMGQRLFIVCAGTVGKQHNQHSFCSVINEMLLL